MSGAHSTTFRYGGAAMQREHVGSWPEGMSPEVRVRYFDPATGEPMETKPARRAKARADDQPKLATSLANVRAKTTERRAQPVIVDGVEYPSVNSAAKAVGCAGCTITRNLRNGATECKGHSIRFKDPRHARA